MKKTKTKLKNILIFLGLAPTIFLLIISKMRIKFLQTIAIVSTIAITTALIWLTIKEQTDELIFTRLAYSLLLLGAIVALTLIIRQSRKKQK